MKIGLIGAIPEEIHLFESFLSRKEQKIVGDSEFVQGNFNKHTITVGFSRCGKVSAANTTSILIHVFRVDLVIFIGTAGGTDSSLNAGDIIIASELIQYDMDSSAFVMHKKFEIPLLGVIRFKVNNKYLDLAQKAIRRFLERSFEQTKLLNPTVKEFKTISPKIICGLIGTGDQFIADKEKIRLLKEELPDIKCVEMEGAAVAQICHCHNIPFLVIRIISDNADENAYSDALGFTIKVAPHLACGIAKNIIEHL